ncbi:MAG: methyltransferase domain-containing protein, partial [Candidatus Thermoplasmatota archaeon]|nr:methyltransferase domain-containing protein [Candidatus Thermoplasmatota archaeon]
MIEKDNLDSSVGSFYQKVWPEYVRWWHVEETLGLHYAYYDDTTNTFQQAILKMNDFAGQLLNLDQTKAKQHVLDAGCGVGGTAIYLGNKYPSTWFTGITICPDQVKLAKKFTSEKNVDNVDFFVQNYLHTDFSDCLFDGVLALESINHTDKYQTFIHEMYRVLKSEGRFVILDLFQRDHIDFNPVMEKIYRSICRDRGFAHPVILDKIIEDLQDIGFEIQTVLDITQHVIRSQFRSFMIGIPFFLSTQIKRHLFIPLKILNNDVDHSFGTSVPIAILGLKGV